jgi:hypothetical protein
MENTKEISEKYYGVKRRYGMRDILHLPSEGSKGAAEY